MGPYTKKIKRIEEENQEQIKKINIVAGVKESDTGLALPA
jgi:26S proteasome regulatory subunit T1